MGRGSQKDKIRRDKRLMRMKQLVAMYLKGSSILEISKKLRITKEVVYKDLHLARLEWRKEASESREILIAEQLKRIDLVEHEAWEAWEKSKLDVEVLTFATFQGEHEIKTRSTKTRKAQCGDAKFLDVALNCVDRRCKILRVGVWSETVRGLGGNSEVDSLQATVVEIVVENREQAQKMMNYEQYQALTTPSEN